ncbi:pyochelin biosynthetic protein PchC [Herbihabitans rhizosphaerae]|uniref:Pyochelin biosynthetic protein PchC n=1 Tax=Herbihabitans rhizosphaerae TaxID=1872711 RepID=A0A4Q7L8N0_9PSEU|nr:alpha/beta fold hydrolase [Herbihabitans rhizosphaerae]RZS45021.1 pyochelin biosynthetic protein PchC [Herbihabitans rhizosphaerae]
MTLRCYERRPGARLRLFCFPHAGGSASSFRTWPELLPADIETHAVQYPGRENRMRDPLVHRMDDLIAEIVDAVIALDDLPFAFFGHSMGAAVAYETAVALRDRGARRPVHLFASAREAPHLARGGDVHLRDEDGICAEIGRLGGTAGEVLKQRELRDLIVPVVRNDYRLIETYLPTIGPPLDHPVTVLRGDVDPEVTEDEALGWKTVAGDRFEVVVFAGDHFFLVPARENVVELVRRELRAHNETESGEIT